MTSSVVASPSSSPSVRSVPSPSPRIPPTPSRTSVPSASSNADVAALALHCGRSLVAHLQDAAADLGGAGALANDATAALRGHLAAALAANAGAADPAECRRHLEAAMAALRCEDASSQLLDSLRRRTLQLVDVVRYVVMPGRDDADPGPVDGERTGREDMAARLRLAVVAMEAGIARSGPVARPHAVAGPVERL